MKIAERVLDDEVAKPYDLAAREAVASAPEFREPVPRARCPRIFVTDPVRVYQDVGVNEGKAVGRGHRRSWSSWEPG